LVCRQETVMKNRTGLLLGVLSLAAATVVTVAPSAAFARTHHKVHVTGSHVAHRAMARTSRAYGPGATNAYGAMPGGSPAPSFGYGVGDNSHGCAACTN
jgi:hypothetical protein